MAWAELEAKLFSRARHGMKLGLERMERALDALGRPERSFRSVHVAGTNGKGSTCAFTERLFREHGLRTGLYTSPHLERFTERIRVNGEEIDESTLVSLHRTLESRIPWAFDGEDALTFFELVTLLAFLHFSEQKVDVVVAETGLGGRLDATNVLRPLACAITPISLDHSEYLGTTLSAIASEKAGILKPRVPCVVAPQSAEALEVIRHRAKEVEAVLELENVDFSLDPSLELGLEGPHQRSNAALALRLFQHVEKPQEALVRRALSETRWPGRFERWPGSPQLILDGAHNPDGGRALARTLKTALHGRTIRLLVGVLADKSPEPILDALAPLAAEIIVTAPQSPRAMEARTLASLARQRHPAVLVEPHAANAVNLARARSAPEDVIVVCGSLYLVGEIRAFLSGQRVSELREFLRPGP